MTRIYVYPLRVPQVDDVSAGGKSCVRRINRRGRRRCVCMAFGVRDVQRRIIIIITITDPVGKLGGDGDRAKTTRHPDEKTRPVTDRGGKRYIYFITRITLFPFYSSLNNIIYNRLSYSDE